jgi:hypothetical protein
VNAGVSRMKRTGFLIATVLVGLAGCDKVFGPKTYEDCIVESMQGVTSDAAAKLIAVSCRKKFPEERAIDDISLLPSVIGALNGHASAYGNTFSGTLYNGDKEWVVTQVTVVLEPKAIKGKKLSLPTREYNVDVTIAPLSSVTFSIPIDSQPDLEFEWAIARGRGYLPGKW